MKRPGSFFALVFAGLVLAVAPARALSTVVIDAGHGGHDRGGVPGDQYAEKIYTLDVAQRVRDRLRAAGFRTIMTRDGDYFVGLGQRCAIANGQRDAIFLCIHFNSAPRRSADGIETYFYSGKSARLAAAVHARLVRAAGTEDRHIRTRGYYVLRHTRIPAVLAEGGFLTNPAEGARIAGSPAYRQALAEALANAVLATYGTPR